MEKQQGAGGEMVSSLGLRLPLQPSLEPIILTQNQQLSFARANWTEGAAVLKTPAGTLQP